MRAASTVLAIARADLKQRVRTHAFLVTLAVTVLSAWQLVPAAGSMRAPMHFGPVRALNTPAGIGASVACMCILWLCLIGFYLTSSTIKRDEDTGVGQIIATTRVGKVTYLLGKALSNFAVLLAVLGTVCLTLVAVLAVKGEGASFDLVALWLPMLALVPPPLALIAALALLSEVLLPRWRGLVNVGFFFLWALLIVGAMELFKGVPLHTPAGQAGDLFAMREVLDSMEDDLVAAEPGHRRGELQINFPLSEQVERTFVFRGFRDVFPLWLYRWAWVGVAALLVAAAAVPFRRFDPSSRRVREVREVASGAEGSRPKNRWRPEIPAISTRSPLLTLVQSELRLLLLGHSRWWWLVTAGLCVASVAAPLDVAHRYILPGLWFWQVLLLSKLGSREVQSRTTEIVFVAPRPLARQLPASLAAGVALLLGLGLPVLLREVLAGRPAGALGVVAGAVFLPALALVLGTWTNGGKAFELLLTVLWYGAMNDAPPLDFTGALAPAAGSATALAYLALGCVFAVLAVPGRLKQLG
jgi:hypothetical protein